jgi:hypothetical protein
MKNKINQTFLHIYLEMEFAEEFAEARLSARIARETTEGLFADDHGSTFGFVIESDPIGTVDFVIGENAVLEYEPTWTPSTAIVDPLVKNPRDSIPYNVVNHNLSVIRQYKLTTVTSRTLPSETLQGGGIRSLDQTAVINAVVDAEALRGPTADVVGSGERSKRRRRRWRCHVQQIR